MKIQGQDEVKKLVQVAREESLNMLLVGETGVGKTTLIQEVAKDHGHQAIRFNLTGETTVDEFVGRFELENQQTVWKDGVLLQAVKNGHWLIVDEINAALPDILFVLHSLLDDDRAVIVANHNGERVEPHKDFRFFATMNPTDEYAGTKELNKAFMSRFDMIAEMQYPDAKTEAKIIKERTGVSSQRAARIADTGALLRKGKADGKIFYTCSTRDLLQWARLSRILKNEAKAFKVTIQTKAGTEAEEVGKAYAALNKKYDGFKREFGYTPTVTQLESKAREVKRRENEIESKIKAQLQQRLSEVIGEANVSQEAAASIGEVVQVEGEAVVPSRRIGKLSNIT